VSVNGSLSGAGDEQHYSVDVASGEHLTIVLDGEENFDVYDLHIKYGSPPTTLDYDDKGDLPNADQAVEVASTAAGTYYVMVRSTSSGGNYTIVAHTAGTFPSLTIGTPRAGSLQNTYDVKFYQVSVTAGERLSVLLDGAENYDTYDLYIKYGALPTTLDYDDKGDLSNTDQAVEVASTAVGTYYLMVRSTSSGGDYTIVAHTASTFPGLTIGTPRAGSLQNTYDVKFYQVTVAAGERLSVLLDGEENYDEYDLYIKYGSLPTTLDYDDKGDLPNADQAVEVASTVAGTYYLMVRSSASGGNYTIVAHTASTFPSLTIGTPRAGSLQNTYDVKVYQVTVPAGQRLSVLLDGEENYDEYDLYLKYGSLPTTLDYDDKGDLPNADQAVEVASTVAGVYYLMVRSSASGGNYTIVAHSASTFPTLTPGVIRYGALQNTYDVKFYQVNTEAAEDLLVLLDGVDPYDHYDLYLRHGALPNLLDYHAKGDGPYSDQSVEIADTSAGTYYAMVRSTAGGGDYAILAALLSCRLRLPLVLR
jgi:hypothetical protein